LIPRGRPTGQPVTATPKKFSLDWHDFRAKLDKLIQRSMIESRRLALGIDRRRLGARATAAPQLAYTSRLIALEPLDLRVQMGGWDHVREIDRQANITCSV
jgi:hypothetical protein